MVEHVDVCVHHHAATQGVQAREGPAGEHAQRRVELNMMSPEGSLTEGRMCCTRYKEMSKSTNLKNSLAMIDAMDVGRVLVAVNGLFDQANSARIADEIKGVKEDVRDG